MSGVDIVMNTLRIVAQMKRDSRANHGRRYNLWFGRTAEGDPVWAVIIGDRAPSVPEGTSVRIMGFCIDGILTRVKA